MMFSMPEFALRRTRPAKSNDPVPEMDCHAAIFNMSQYTHLLVERLDTYSIVFIGASIMKQ